MKANQTVSEGALVGLMNAGKAQQPQAGARPEELVVDRALVHNPLPLMGSAIPLLAVLSLGNYQKFDKHLARRMVK